MRRVCFVVGHDDSYDSPSDTPEAYWRVALPAQHLGAQAAVLGIPGAEKRALEAEVVWIHQPTSFSAAALAEQARRQGRAVIVDFSEDPWARGEIGRPYAPARLAAAERALEAATLIVVAHERLASVFHGFGPRVQVLRPVIPLGAGWEVQEPSLPPRLVWWCDGRQRRGFEDVAPGIRRAMEATAIRVAHVQFAHQQPLVAGIAGREEAKERASRLSSYFANDRDLSAEANMHIFRGILAGAALSLECYPASSYRESVSDLAILRAAALGVPTLTTRLHCPEGALSAAPEEWADTILSILGDPALRQDLSQAARGWAETRTSYSAYHATIEEVL